MVHKDAIVTEGTEKPSEKDSEGKINDVMTGPQEGLGGRSRQRAEAR